MVVCKCPKIFFMFSAKEADWVQLSGSKLKCWEAALLTITTLSESHTGQLLMARLLSGGPGRVRGNRGFPPSSVVWQSGTRP